MVAMGIDKRVHACCLKRPCSAPNSSRHHPQSQTQNGSTESHRKIQPLAMVEELALRHGMGWLIADGCVHW